MCCYGIVCPQMFWGKDFIGSFSHPETCSGCKRRLEICWTTPGRSLILIATAFTVVFFGMLSTKKDRNEAGRSHVDLPLCQVWCPVMMNHCWIGSCCDMGSSSFLLSIAITWHSQVEGPGAAEGAEARQDEPT